MHMARAATIAAYIAFSMFAFAPVAAADGTPPGGVVTIPDLWLTFLVASVLPIVVGLIKSRYSSSRLGALLLLFFSVISGWLTSLSATDGTFEVKTAFTSIFISFVTAAGFHYGFLKPTGTTEAVVKAVPGGVGGKKKRKVAREAP